MKRLIVAVVVVGVSVLAGLGFYVKQHNTPAVSAESEITADSPGGEPQAVEPVAAAFEQPAQRETPSDASNAKPNPREVPAVMINHGLNAAFLSRSVDLLVSPQSGYQQKQEAWKQLRESGKLDEVIVELEHRMTNDPRIAEYPAALGQACLKKCGTIQDVREQAVLAMQADKLFDTALNLDASNWDARFTKAVGMSYWPATLNKGEEVIQHFQTLIQQQETQAPQPQFAETYAWLGDQYQKAGRGDDARTVWQRGAALFPADEKLQAKLTSKP